MLQVCRVIFYPFVSIANLYLSYNFTVFQWVLGLSKNAARSTNVAKSHECLTSYLSGKFYKRDSSKITQSCLPLNENFVFLLFYQMNFLNNFVRYLYHNVIPFSSKITQSCLPLNENFVFLLFYQMNFLNNFVRYLYHNVIPFSRDFFWRLESIPN